MVNLIIPVHRYTFQKEQGFISCFLPGYDLYSPEGFTLSVSGSLHEVADLAVQPFHCAVALVINTASAIRRFWMCFEIGMNSPPS